MGGSWICSLGACQCITNGRQLCVPQWLDLCDTVHPEHWLVDRDLDTIYMPKLLLRSSRRTSLSQDDGLIIHPAAGARDPWDPPDAGRGILQNWLRGPRTPVEMDLRMKDLRIVRAVEGICNGLVYMLQECQTAGTRVEATQVGHSLQGRESARTALAALPLWHRG